MDVERLIRTYPCKQMFKLIRPDLRDDAKQVVALAALEAMQTFKPSLGELIPWQAFYAAGKLRDWLKREQREASPKHETYEDSGSTYPDDSDPFEIIEPEDREILRDFIYDGATASYRKYGFKSTQAFWNNCKKRLECYNLLYGRDYDQPHPSLGEESSEGLRSPRLGGCLPGRNNSDVGRDAIFRRLKRLRFTKVPPTSGVLRSDQGCEERSQVPEGASVV